MSAPSIIAFDSKLLQNATPIDMGINRTIILQDIRQFTLVEEGELDLFAVPVVDGQPAGRWSFLGRLERGAVILGAPLGPRHGLLARPSIGSRILSIPTGDLVSLSGDDATPRAAAQLVSGVEQVIVALANSLRTKLPPRDFTPLVPGESARIKGRGSVRSVEGVQWVEVVTGSVEMADDANGALNPGELLCITERDWLTATEPTVLNSRTTGELLAARELWERLIVHTARTLYAIDRRVERRDEDERIGLEARRQLDQNTMKTTAQRFESLLRDTDAKLRLADTVADPPALAAMRVLAAHLGFPVKQPPPGSVTTRNQSSIEAIAMASGARLRTIRLDGLWWKQDLGHLIAYRKGGEQPVALLRISGKYLIAEAGRVTQVTQAVSETLTKKGTAVYQPLPAAVKTVGGLLKFGISGNRADLWRFAGIGLLVAIIGLLAPLMTGAVLGTFVSQAQTSFIIQGSLLVIAAAFVVGALSVVQNFAVLRIESRSTEKMQSGMWMRLLSLPATFFGKYSTGALGTQVMGVSAAQEMLSGVVTTATVGLITGLANLLLVFLIDVQLALIGAGLLAVALVVAGVAGYLDIGRQRAVYENEQKVASRVFQLLTAVPKLRVAAAEDRAFGVWAEEFTKGRSLSASSRRVQNMLATFNSGFPIVCSVVIFAIVGGPMAGELSVTTFLSFFASFSLLIASSLQFTGAAITAIGIVPMLQKLTPILEAEPEVNDQKADPGDLSGRVALSGVAFRYGDGPLVLDDVSITVDVGEFVAIVGPSGSGKSTILRLLLGFESPSAGSVLYDGQDLSELEVSAVRRQCGVVLQNGSLMAGDIKTNIIGSTTYTVADAWKAAEMAGIATDIKAMPMGMNTVLSEGANALSGGQRQRMMIARSLIGRPRIVLFDEATSALDNPTQQMVAESTRRLNASRIVIAHRLSTIANADKIVVLDKGKVVQVGTYEELMAEPDSVFHKLARRQMS